MREILFRGKRKDNGEWVENPIVVELRNGQKYIPDNFAPSGLKIDENGNKVSFVAWFHEVIPETVGQYTGLTDKNGKKIFEGDIISTDITRPYLIVEFRDGCFMFNCNDGGEDYYDIMLPILKEAQTQYKYGEIIGNITDNPELLKGGAE